MQVAIYGRPVSMGSEDTIGKLLDLLRREGIGVFMYKPFSDFLRSNNILKEEPAGLFNTHEDIIGNADIMLSLGGDGTFLESVSFVQDYGIPVVGINTGRLGFLADIPSDQIETSLLAIFKQEYTIENRTLVKLELIGSQLDGFCYALNEVSVQKQHAAMITIHTYLNDSYLNSYWADGLIISTPTGSTAYSMSVGGPILTPDSNSFIISPMSPHNLTIRPLVIPDTNCIRIEVESREKSYLLTIDSRTEVIDGNMKLLLKKADFTLKTLRINEATFYNTLRNKLMWGVDKRN
ncbi:NAD kinase [Bacteroidota bacterium]